MSRSYKKVWISRNNMKFGKIASNRILRRIPILDRNGEDETILSGKNKRHRRGAGINPYDISDYVTRYKCSFTHRREDFPDYLSKHYETHGWTPKYEIIKPAHYLDKQGNEVKVDFFWDVPKEFAFIPAVKSKVVWEEYTYYSREHRDLYYRMWMK